MVGFKWCGWKNTPETLTMRLGVNWIQCYQLSFQCSSSIFIFIFWLILILYMLLIIMGGTPFMRNNGQVKLIQYMYFLMKILVLLKYRQMVQVYHQTKEESKFDGWYSNMAKQMHIISLWGNMGLHIMEKQGIRGKYIIMNYDTF